MDKQEFFWTPTAKRDIIGERDIWHFGGDEFYHKDGLLIPGSELEDRVDATFNENRRELVDTIEGAKPNEAVVIHFPIIPSEFDDHNNFSKHGRHIRLHKKGMSQQDAQEIGKRPWESRRDVFADLPENVSFAGYQWDGLGGLDRRSRQVSLTALLKAARLFAFTENSENPRDKILIPSELEPKYKSNTEGATYVTQVPSRSIDFLVQGERKTPFYRTVTLHSVPIKRWKDKYAVVHNLEHDCECEWVKVRRIHFQDDKTKKKRGIIFCPHAIAGYMAVMGAWVQHYRDAGYQEQPEIMHMNPFALPRGKRKPDAVAFYKKLLSQVMVRTHKVDFYRGNHVHRRELQEQGFAPPGKGRYMVIQGGRNDTTHLRPLNDAEQEILLWEFVKKYDARAFFAKGKIKNYNWDLPTAKEVL